MGERRADGVLAPGRQPVRTASLRNLGCKVNQAEVDAVERFLRARGVEIVGEGAAADLVLVNTCTVTAVADDKSRKAVRRARRTSPNARLLVTGCAVQVDAAAFSTLDPLSRLVPNEEKEGLLGEVACLLAGGDGSGRGADGASGIRRTRAYVKVQDGCSFHCTYCIIPRARGAERSVPPEAILADARHALADGHREIVLTGINIGTYDGGWSERGRRGIHARSALTLAGLVRRVLAETEVERIRLSSIEPQHVDDELLVTWAGEGDGRCLPHLHLPLQSGDDGVLRRMGRRYDAAAYARVVERARAAIPGVAIHADVIAGFPGEDDAAFERSLAFIRALDPAGLHVFRYSARPGVPSTRMAGQVAEVARRERAAVLLGEAAAARERFAARAVGGQRTVLVETALETRGPAAGWVGHAQDYLAVRIPGSAAAAPTAGDAAPGIGPGPLAPGDIVTVVIEAIDPSDPGRAVGRLAGVTGRSQVPGRSRSRGVPCTA